jgi:alkanesulfonate monooxygenase SsuD/methylene tetrahydromethanopterin reductase-like flavin-dependent oxidoreductase (luciferase family)
MTMTFGIHVGHLGGPMDELRKLWRFADAAGFDWTSVADHFQESPPQGGDGDCFEAIASYTAMAMETKRVRLGALVFCVNYRNPGLLAKSLCTIDHLSGGRVECGIGAGWHESEYRGFGIPFERIGVREDQLEEAVQILRLLFDQKVSSFDGKHFKLVDARCNP